MGVVFSAIVFCRFNVLEATLPSMISKIAPLAAKGTAMGIYAAYNSLVHFPVRLPEVFYYRISGGMPYLRLPQVCCCCGCWWPAP